MINRSKKITKSYSNPLKKYNQIVMMKKCLIMQKQFQKVKNLQQILNILEVNLIQKVIYKWIMRLAKDLRQLKKEDQQMRNSIQELIN